MRGIVVWVIRLCVALLAVLLLSLRVLAPRPGESEPLQLAGQMQLQENNAGLPTPSDTYNAADQGTSWPVDPFTAQVSGHISPLPIDQPARHSYDGDGNMESLDAFGPFSKQEDRTRLARYTGAVGPAGGSTPESHPELTAP